MCEFIPARLVLSFLAFIGFTNLYLIRFNFSVITVSMITRLNPVQRLCQNDLNCTINNSSTSIFNNQLVGNDSAVDINISNDTLDWDEKTRAMVLGAFFYGYCMTQIAGGRLAEVFGTRIVFGVSVLVPAVLSLLLPVFSRISYWGTFVIRFLQGFFQGMSWPAMHALLCHWFPVSERSRYMGTVFFASTLSMVYIMPLSGYLCEVFSWEAAFYITGAIPIIWSVFWFTMVYDKPSLHPRISDTEKFYIEEAVFGSGTSKEKMKTVPWRAIVTSMPFIAIVVSEIGNSYCIVIFTSQMANFLSSVYNLSLSKTGFLAGVPFLCRYIGSTTFSIIADYLLKRKVISVAATRRIFSAIALFIPALMVVFVITTTRNDPMAFIGCVCAYMFFNGGVAASKLVNNLDIAPNFAGTLFGISNTAASLISAVSIWISGQILNENNSWEDWRIVFSTMIPALVLCEIFYLIFLSGTPQEWNFYQSVSQNERNVEGVR